MSDGSGTCEYVLDPDDPKTWSGAGGETCIIDDDVLNEDGVWNCPHKAVGEVDGEQQCIFHYPTDKKEDTDVLDTFLEQVKKLNNDQSNIAKLQFLGAKLGKLDLSELGIKTDTKKGFIDFSHSEIHTLKISNSEFEIEKINILSTKINNLKIDNSEFNTVVNFRNSTFSERISIKSSSFNNQSEFAAIGLSDSEFKARFNFKKVRIYGRVLFNQAHFKKEADFTLSHFNGISNFRSATFEETAHFGGCKFEGDTIFESKFNSGCDFTDVTASGTLVFEGCKLEEKGKFLRSNITGSQFNKFEAKGCDFEKANLTDCSFIDAKLPDADFEQALFSRATLFRADLRGAKLNGAVLGDIRIDEETQFLGTPNDDSSSTSYTFSSWLSKPSVIYDERYGEKQSTISYVISLPLRFLLSVYSIILFVTNLVPQEPKENFRNWVRWLGGQLRSLTLKPIEWMKNEPDQESEKGTDGKDAKSDESQQKGGDTETIDNNENQDDSKDAQSDGGNRSEIGDQDDPVDKDKAKSVYRALEELGGKAARSRLQSQAFVRRQDVQKREYKRRAVDGGIRQERVIGAAKYLRAKVARVTLLYGESPWRIIGISSTFVFLVGLVYPLFGWVQPREGGAEPITWTRILDGEPYLLFESIYFSALTFTTLGMGDYEPVGGGGQVLATLNTAFGAILVALLVFVLGRRAAR